MPKPQKDRTTVTQPKGANPLGSHRPVRDRPDQRAATDTPFEIPAYITYDRHTAGRDGLAGWAINIDLFTFGAKVTAKIFRKPHKLVIYVEGKEVFSSKVVAPKKLHAPPRTTPEPKVGDEEEFEEF